MCLTVLTSFRLLVAVLLNNNNDGNIQSAHPVAQSVEQNKHNRTHMIYIETETGINLTNCQHIMHTLTRVQT